MIRTRGQQRLIALFFAALMALNYPLLSLWSSPTTVFGLPLFATALFGLWAILIATMAWLLEHAGD
ncbi:MAG: hypothetical protein KDH93_23335 [Rhodoferax sp.]|nr:hypothetical protein [Rhodoferax sp.]MCB2007963.1 hypothetical protein [Rhodoferax sp.]MCP5263479.1 hypothetical protein [Rhodoferax sp.]